MNTEERHAHITAIRDLPQRLREVVRGLNDTQLDTPYRDGGWTVRQVVHHLADSHAHAFLRMKFILTEDHPTLKPYDQDIWAAQPDVLLGPIEPSLVLLMGLHERWVRMLHDVPEDGWHRTALHPERGTLTLEDMLTTYARHGVKHVGQIRELRRARGWA